MIVGRVLRSVFALFVGMATITFLTESIEYGLVAWVNGGIPDETGRYWEVRNGGLFLSAKMVYNTLAAVVGGWLTARIVGWRPGLHGVVLASLQTGGFVYALLSPSLRETGPLWMWLALIPLTIAGIAVGSMIGSCGFRTASPGSRAVVDALSAGR